MYVTKMSVEEKSFRSRFRLAPSVRMADACAALLVGNIGFHTKGAEVATVGCTYMTSAL